MPNRGSEELAETVRQIQAYGRKGESVRADIRDIGASRAAADGIEKSYGKIDIMVANTAIQRWNPLLGLRYRRAVIWHARRSMTRSPMGSSH